MSCVDRGGPRVRSTGGLQRTALRPEHNEIRGRDRPPRRRIASALVTTVALLATLVLIFAFQADNLTGRFFHVFLIAVPIVIQVYFNSGLAHPA
jgi:hypothetical protein